MRPCDVSQGTLVTGATLVRTPSPGASLRTRSGKHRIGSGPTRLLLLRIRAHQELPAALAPFHDHGILLGQTIVSLGAELV